MTLSGNYETFKDYENESFKLFMKNVAIIKQGQITDYFKKIETKEKPLQQNEEKKKP